VLLRATEVIGAVMAGFIVALVIANVGHDVNLALWIGLSVSAVIFICALVAQHFFGRKIAASPPRTFAKMKGGSMKGNQLRTKGMDTVWDTEEANVEIEEQDHE
jgi:hypothetical protein